MARRSPILAAVAVVVLTVPLVVAADAVAATTTSRNLIVNGNAEAGIGRPLPGWTNPGGLGIQSHVYGEDGSPLVTDPGPANRGASLIDGGWPEVGVDDRLEVGTQTRSLTAYVPAIDAGTATYALSGWLGGYNDQRDNATLEIHFYATGSTASLGTARIGPVTPQQRHMTRGLLHRTATGVVPPGSRKVVITLTLRRFDGGYNDGYADNLILTITTP